MTAPLREWLLRLRAATADRLPSMPKPLGIGDRIRVSGGYDMYPAWLAAHGSGYVGEVVEFIPGRNKPAAAVVALDDELVLPNGAGAVEGQLVRGHFLVLELGHVGADWGTSRPRIHVELCEERPPAARWQDRRQGAWVESHATYDVIRRGSGAR